MAKIIRRKQVGDAAEISQVHPHQEAELPMPMADPEAQQITELIRKRRSVFPQQYRPGTIPREQVELILQNAHWAPTHGKTEPWHFIVFSGESLKTFGEAHANLYRAHTPPDQFEEKKYNKLKNKPLACSHLIVICMKRGDNPKIPEIEEVEAVACAVQNMHLTATALGLGAYWGSGGMTYHDSLRDHLGLGPEDRVLGLFHLGYLEGTWPQGQRQTNWTDKVEWR